MYSQSRFSPRYSTELFSKTYAVIKSNVGSGSQTSGVVPRHTPEGSCVMITAEAGNDNENSGKIHHKQAVGESATLY